MQTFLDDVWGASHCHMKRARAGYFDSLLPGSSTVGELLAPFRQETSAVRLVRKKENKAPNTYRLADGSLDLVRIHEDFADGCTIVLDSVERYVRAIASLAHSIEAELNFATKVNAYVTPPNPKASSPTTTTTTC